jgi:hypothetical protein
MDGTRGKAVVVVLRKNPGHSLNLGDGGSVMGLLARGYGLIIQRFPTQSAGLLRPLRSLAMTPIATSQQPMAQSP